MLVTFQSNKYDAFSFDSVSCFGSLLTNLPMLCKADTDLPCVSWPGT